MLKFAIVALACAAITVLVASVIGTCDESDACTRRGGAPAMSGKVVSIGTPLAVREEAYARGAQRIPHYDVVIIGQHGYRVIASCPTEEAFRAAHRLLSGQCERKP